MQISNILLVQLFNVTLVSNTVAAPWSLRPKSVSLVLAFNLEGLSVVHALAKLSVANMFFLSRAKIMDKLLECLVMPDMLSYL